MFSEFYHTKMYSRHTHIKLPVTSKKYKISLIMEGDTLSALKLWIMRKKGCQKAGNRMTKSCTEVIQDNFRPMARHTTMVLQGKCKHTLY